VVITALILYVLFTHTDLPWWVWALVLVGEPLFWLAVFGWQDPID
jgi:hypothetical protein